MKYKKIYSREVNNFSLNSSYAPEKELANYLFNVLRLKNEEKIIIFNDSSEFLCIVSDADNKEILILDEIDSDYENKTHITLILPLMKGKKLKEVVKKSIEIGVDSIFPFSFNRCIKKIKDGNKLKNDLLTWAGAAASQSYGKIPQFHDFSDNMNDLIDFLETYDVKILFSPVAREDFNIFHNKNFKKLALISGPEGGFEDSEIELLKNNGVKDIRLNTNVLRCETAPVAGLILSRHIFSQELQEDHE